MNPRDTAIEALEYIGGVLTMHTSISTRRPTPDEYEHALKDCDTALAALRSEVHEEKWISVNTRLPSVASWVMVYALHRNEMLVSMYMIDGMDEEGLPIWITLYGPQEIDPTDVTHWMPLPQPPKP